ncbi:MAG: tyrosine-type recombinase/integrase [Fastidiosipilaceae bacterium]
MNRSILDKKNRIMSTYNNKDILLLLCDFLGISFERLNDTFSDVFDLWSSEKFITLSQSSIKNYRAAFNKAQMLHETPFRLITQEMFQQEIDAYQHQSHTCQMYLLLLFTQLSEKAVALGIIRVNLAQGCKIRAVRVVRKNPYSLNEIQQFHEIYEITDSEIALYCLMGIYTGLRPTELAQIRVADIDLTRSTIFTSGSKTSAGKDRLIGLHRFLRTLLKPILTNNTDEYLFSYGAVCARLAYNRMHREFRTFHMELEFAHTPHDLRHTFSSIAYMSGMDELAIKLTLGHYVKDLTQRVYTHIDQAFLISEINRLPMPGDRPDNT